MPENINFLSDLLTGISYSPSVGFYNVFSLVDTTLPVVASLEAGREVGVRGSQGSGEASLWLEVSGCCFLREGLQKDF